eukprot:m.333389 g.333389  ORF g.333389 m.333389 type:complete len:354 (+) comp16063_c1_seq3:291-1352(+)
MFKPFIFKRNKSSYHVFVSYRHGDFDSLATAQFVNSIDGLLLADGTILNPFYDAFSLSEGERFDVEFMIGMCNSVIVVPFVSMDALKRMMDLDSIKNVDNVTGVGTGVPSMDNLFVHFNAEHDLPNKVNKATHARLVEFCSDHLPHLPEPKRKSVRKIVSETFRFNASKCLCWDIANKAGGAAHGGSRRAMGFEHRVPKARLSQPSFHQKVTELSTHAKDFLRIFSVCGREVTTVLEMLLAEQDHSKRSTGWDGTESDGVEGKCAQKQAPGVALATTPWSHEEVVSRQPQLQDMMARSKVFSRYIPAVIENEVDLEVIEIYTPLQLTELLGFSAVHAAAFPGWLAKQKHQFAV